MKLSKKKVTAKNGSHLARIVSMIDIGQQKNIDWKTKEVKLREDGSEVIQRIVRITFQLVNHKHVFDEDIGEQPFHIDKEFAVSSSSKAGIVKLVQAVLPDAMVESGSGEYTNFDFKDDDAGLFDILGKPLVVTIGKTAGGNDKITTTAPIIEGTEVTELSSNAVSFSIDEPNEDVFNNLPKFVKEKISTRVGIKSGDFGFVSEEL